MNNLPDEAGIVPEAAVTQADQGTLPTESPSEAPSKVVIEAIEDCSHGTQEQLGEFVRRHIGPSEEDTTAMLAVLGYSSLDAFMRDVIPNQILSETTLSLPPALSEREALEELMAIALQNEQRNSYIGMGYSETVTPSIILRNILEDSGWLTAYTPYQAEISQGRLEALFNFQTMIADLTGMDVANASLLDEGTAAAEAMTMAHRIGKGKKNVLFVASDCHPQTIAVIETRAKPLGIEIVVGDPGTFEFSDQTCGVIIQSPNTNGEVRDYKNICDKAHAKGALAIVATDPLALTMLRTPREAGADIALGSTQRFGAPMGFGGPHAAFFATKQEHMRQMPGRLVGATKDAHGNRALRLALGAREQHIRGEKATSNICTSQVLLAVMASMYGVYHGPDGLKAIASRIHKLTKTLADGLRQLGYAIPETEFFDTIKIPVSSEDKAYILDIADEEKVNLRVFEDALGISIGETTTPNDIQKLLDIFSMEEGETPDANALFGSAGEGYDESLARTSEFMTAPVFHRHHSEMEMMRYIESLRAKDISLTRSAIMLGSCSMKLSGTSAMRPITWPQFANMHPFAPEEQTIGYQEMISDLERWLAEITGFEAVSLQPNAGSQGEYAGLQVIQAYHRDRGEGHRKVCLIPDSAHGTNPASAAMAGMQVVKVKCTKEGNIDIDDLRAKAKENAQNLSAIMITYPSTHGVFEEDIKEMCDIVHEQGGQVYMDGANMNAQVGYCRPGKYGADVMHLNLHKTFGLPHGGGGPGVGPIAVAGHLADFLPKHPVVETGGKKGIGPVSSAPWGSASILPIAWMYIRMMGAEGLKRATAIAVLNANYISAMLASSFPTLFKNKQGRVAHECILDPRLFERLTGVSAFDIAKRLADIGFHAPTVAFPVHGTLMIEPTESESLAHIDRFVEAMRIIHEEIMAVMEGVLDKDDNPLKNAPHTAASLLTDQWDHSYSREQAAYAAPWVEEGKYWPPVGRVDDTYGDRNPVLTIPKE